MRYVCIVSVLWAGMTGVAPAQEPPMSTIETDGIAVVDAEPNVVDFWYHLVVQDPLVGTDPQNAALGNVVDRTIQFEPTLRAELKTRELTPLDIGFSGVSVPDVQSVQAQVSARVRFRANTFAAPDEGPRQFAALCDKIRGLAAALSLTVEGPYLDVEDRASIEESAIARATEKAYPAARAAAQVMNGQITAVLNVAVDSLTWNEAPDTRAAQPDSRRLTCTARVRVTYVFTPAT